MTIEEIQQLIKNDEHRTLELKKTTGELKDAMQSACAFLNTEGGWLIFGIAPKSLKMVGQMVTDNTQREIAQALSLIEPAVDVRVQYVEVPDSGGQQLVAMHFDAWKEGQVPYTFQRRPYYRVESTTKVMPREIYDERIRCSNPHKFAWEAQKADGISVADLDEQRIRAAIRLGVAGGRINASAEGDSLETLLSKFKLLNDGVPTNAAVVLFGKNTDCYPQLLLRMARFKGTDKMEFIDNMRATGNFFDLLDAGIAFCFKHLNLSGKIVGLRREEHLDIPVVALREALTNALCHRRYDDPRASVSLAIFDDRVEITNPGRFPAGLTPENIKESHESFPYNLRVAQVLYLSTYLEGWGTGVRRMTDLCREQGVPEPEFQTDGYTIKVIFWKSSQKTSQKDDLASQKNPKSSQKELNKSQKAILDKVLHDPNITTEELAEALGIMRRNIQENINILKEQGRLQREGGRKFGKWVVIDQEQNEEE